MHVRSVLCASLVTTGLLCSSSAHAQRRSRNPSSASPPPASGAATAVQQFNRGMDLYDRHDYSGALSAFRASYEASPSPNSQLYVARSLRELGDLAGAVAQFQATVAEATRRAATEARYVPTRDAAREELRQLEARTARLRFDPANMPAGARLRVDGRDVPAASLDHPVVVPPGHVSVTVEAPGHELFSTTVSVVAGAEAPVTVVMMPAEATAAPASMQGPPAPVDPGGPLRIASISAFGIGVVGIVGSIVFGVSAGGAFATVDANCNGITCPANVASTLDSARTFETLGQVSLGIGVAGVLAGAGLFYMSVRANRTDSVQVGTTGNGLIVRGFF